jgi:ribosomal protein L37E
MPSWDDHYGESDSPAARYQAALDREFRVRMVEGTPVPGGWSRPVEPSCERCSYVIVDGACVGCGPWAHPSLSERDSRSRPGGYPADTAVPRVAMPPSASRSERDAA